MRCSGRSPIAPIPARTCTSMPYRSARPRAEDRPAQRGFDAADRRDAEVPDAAAGAAGAPVHGTRPRDLGGAAACRRSSRSRPGTAIRWAIGMPRGTAMPSAPSTAAGRKTAPRRLRAGAAASRRKRRCARWKARRPSRNGARHSAPSPPERTGAGCRCPHGRCCFADGAPLMALRRLNPPYQYSSEWKRWFAHDGFAIAS